MLECGVTTRAAYPSERHNRHQGMTMSEQAAPPQPTSSPHHIEVLVGEWDMVGTHPGFPSPVRGRSTFSW